MLISGRMELIDLKCGADTWMGYSVAQDAGLGSGERGPGS
jgi:hypothetical protein